METLGNEQITKIQPPQQFLEKRNTALFITIPQTTYKTQELHDKIIQYKQVKYALFKKEEHKDHGEHIHILLKFKQQVKTKLIHKIIEQTKGTYRGAINYKKPEHIGKCISYLYKIETAIEEPIEYGERPLNQGGQYKETDQEYLVAIEQAENGQTEEALETIKKIDPKEYLKYKETFRENLTTENKVRKYYTLPDYTKATLSSSQKEVWDILQTAPKPRRIIWVSGEYGSGKSFLYQYIKSNHEYLMYDAGQSASLDNVAYGYDQEGVIAWDLPRTFDFEEKGDHIANVIEKFSDFGQSITSKKYKGKTQQVRGHTIVFSNREPLEQLAHRDIVHINLEKEIPPQEKEIPPQVKDINNEGGRRKEVADSIKELQELHGNETLTRIEPNILKVEYRDQIKYRVIIHHNKKKIIKSVNTLEEAEELIEQYKLMEKYQ